MNAKVIIILVSFFSIVSCSDKSGSKTRNVEIGNESELTELRVAAYNVEVSSNATAQEIGEALKSYDLDIVGFSEAPGGSWTQEVADVLGMEHVVTGRYTTAGHDDKYKTIASKTPLYDVEEILMTDTLHTVTRAKMKIGEKEVAVYSLHFPFGWRDQAHIDETTAKITSFVDYLEEKQDEEISLAIGDFNFVPSTPGQEDSYYEMFVDIGLDFSWDDLGIDITQHSTHNAFNPEDKGNGNVIDHIMYNPAKVMAVEGGIIEMDPPLSDHKPVWALLQIK